MKLTCSKSKNATTYYIQISIPIGNKKILKMVKYLGSIKEKKPVVAMPLPSSRKKNTQAEKELKQGILIKHSASNNFIALALMVLQNVIQPSTIEIPAPPYPPNYSWHSPVSWLPPVL